MKTYFTETAFGFIAAILLSSAAFAGPFGLPDHVQDGYRDTGCEIDMQSQIVNDEGDYLYSNNPTCPDQGGAGFDLAALQAAFPAPVPGEEEEPIEVDPETPCKLCLPETK